MQVALSPCPNDTFIFYAWIHGKVGNLPIEPVYADLVDLNPWALAGRYPLIKLSFGAYLQAQKHYLLLPVGAALGFNQGPKLVAKTHDQPILKIAVPGQLTTANLLLDRLLDLECERIYCRYDKVCDLILDGTCDAGVIIHETRFTFEKMGLVERCDLGSLWKKKMHLPLPLGGLAIARNLENKQEIFNTLQASIDYAYAHKDEVIPFMIEHAIEKDQKIIEQHVKTYITEESYCLSPTGMSAIEKLIMQPKELWYYEADIVCTN